MAKDTAHTAQRACTSVIRSQVGKGTAHATQHTERAHRSTGAKWPGTTHTQQTHRAGTPVNESQAAKDTAHTTQHPERTHR